MYELCERVALLPYEDFREAINYVFSALPLNGSENVNILLRGGVGSGKSSFVSSVDSVIENRISRRALSGKKMNAAPVTECLRKYGFYRDGELCFSIWDTPGWTSTSDPEKELKALLGAGESISDAVHALVLFVPCGCPPEDELKLLKAKELADRHGVPVTFFLTKFDTIQFGYHYAMGDFRPMVPVVQKHVEYLSETMGVPPNHVIPVRNYCTEYEASQDTGAFVLLGLQAALATAIDGLKDNAYLWTNQEKAALPPLHKEDKPSALEDSEEEESESESEWSEPEGEGRESDGKGSESEGEGSESEEEGGESEGEGSEFEGEGSELGEEGSEPEGWGVEEEEEGSELEGWGVEEEEEGSEPELWGVEEEEEGSEPEGWGVEEEEEGGESDGEGSELGEEGSEAEERGVEEEEEGSEWEAGWGEEEAGRGTEEKTDGEGTQSSRPSSPDSDGWLYVELPLSISVDQGDRTEPEYNTDPSLEAGDARTSGAKAEASVPRRTNLFGGLGLTEILRLTEMLFADASVEHGNLEGDVSAS